MISHKHKFIFIHINKTGGSSIERAIDPSIPTHNNKTNRVCPSATVGNTYHETKHFPARKMWANHPDCFDLYFKFTFVRNPWATEASLYNWFKFIGVARGTKLSFKEFLYQRVKLKRMGFRIMLGNSKQYSLMDYIGRFENLQEDFNIICDKIGIPQQQLPHKNKIKHKHYTEYYDDETRQIVAEKYAEDIEYFGYKFGE